VSKTQNKADVYMDILKNSAPVVFNKPGGTRIVGGVTARFSRSLNDELLENGANNYIDAYSSHFYEAADKTSPDQTDFFIPKFEKFRSHLNHKGEPLDFLVTEYSTCVNPSWLETAHLPTKGMSLLDACGTTTRVLACLKALGVKQVFQYRLSAQPYGQVCYRVEFSEMIDVNGSPLPPLAAFTAAVHFLEDATPRGVKKVTVGDAIVTIASFEKAGKALDVVWSSKPIGLGEITDFNQKKRSFYDLMGNPIAGNALPQVSLLPVYIIE
jgi:hypothetical protein